jgi:hypothetical protein
MIVRRLSAICVIVVLLASMAPADPPPSCKPVNHYGVSGCAPLPDQSCPPGYHKKAVGPPNPQMMGPTFLMCVADQPPAKDQAPKPQPKPAP